MVSRGDTGGVCVGGGEMCWGGGLGGGGRGPHCAITGMAASEAYVGITGTDINKVCWLDRKTVSVINIMYCYEQLYITPNGVISVF